MALPRAPMSTGLLFFVPAYVVRTTGQVDGVGDEWPAECERPPGNGGRSHRQWEYSVCTYILVTLGPLV